jgi:hypothetical protein
MVLANSDMALPPGHEGEILRAVPGAWLLDALFLLLGEGGNFHRNPLDGDTRSLAEQVFRGEFGEAWRVQSVSVLVEQVLRGTPLANRSRNILLFLPTSDILGFISETRRELQEHFVQLAVEAVAS